jgi:hypothetical protein
MTCWCKGPTLSTPVLGWTSVTRVPAFFIVFENKVSSINTGRRISGYGMHVTRLRDVSKRTQETVFEMPLHLESKKAIGTEYPIL